MYYVNMHVYIFNTNLFIKYIYMQYKIYTDNKYAQYIYDVNKRFISYLIVWQHCYFRIPK